MTGVLQVAIIAGGLGTRLGPLTKDAPKSMVRIGNKPFLEHQLEFLRRGGIEDVVLCVGYLGEVVEDYFGNGHAFGLRLSYSYEDKPLGTAGALKQAEPLLDSPFFTLYGDSYLFIDFKAVWAYFDTRKELALMTVYKNSDNYDKSNTIIGDGLVTHYSKEGQHPGKVYIEYGANILRKQALDMIPPNHPYSLEVLFQKLIGAKQLLAYEVKQRFYEIGSLRGLAEFEQFVKSGR